MNNLFVLIDSIIDNKQGYFIDYLPKQVIGERYFELEEYFLKTYLSEFSKKICRIVIKLISYYDFQLCLCKFGKGSKDKLRDMYKEGTDLRYLSLFEISDIITYIIENETTSLSIILGSDTLFGVGSGFAIDVYTLNDEKFELIETLVKQEGLFIGKHR